MSTEEPPAAPGFEEHNRLVKQIQLLQDELALLKTNVYVVHKSCGSIVESAADTTEEGLMYVICPTCDTIVTSDSLSDGDNHYLVRKPQ